MDDTISAELPVVAAACFPQQALNVIGIHGNTTARVPKFAPQMRDTVQVAQLLGCTRRVHIHNTYWGHRADAITRANPIYRGNQPTAATLATLRQLNIRQRMLYATFFARL